MVYISMVATLARTEIICLVNTYQCQVCTGNATRAQQLLRRENVWPQWTWAEKWGGAVSLSVVELGPLLTQCGLK